MGTLQWKRTVHIEWKGDNPIWDVAQDSSLAKTIKVLKEETWCHCQTLHHSQDACHKRRAEHLRLKKQDARARTSRHSAFQTCSILEKTNETWNNLPEKISDKTKRENLWNKTRIYRIFVLPTLSLQGWIDNNYRGKKFLGEITRWNGLPSRASENCGGANLDWIVELHCCDICVSWS